MRDRTVKAFSKFVKEGHYEKDTKGLFGKYDNVRLYWEDKITQAIVRPYIARFLNELDGKSRGLRVLDLGCGSGESYELLTSIEKEDAGINTHQVTLMGSDAIEKYTGLDLNPDMVAQAEENYGGEDKFSFKVADLSEGIPTEKDEGSYDLYMSSYGSPSHVTDEGLKKLLTDVAEHARSGSIFIGDFLGRYSYEWPPYWKDGHMREYSMSWLYPDQMEAADRFPLRFWSREEMEGVMKEVEEETSVKLKPLTFFDRSIFVGRHVNTQYYNKKAQPLRRVVSSLHADNIRTDLNDLIVDIPPVEGFDEQNRFFAEQQKRWNTLVEHTIDIVNNPNQWGDLPDSVEEFDVCLRKEIRVMNRVIQNVGWMKMGDPRANIIEPQLGYALRELEMGYQEGKGMSHAMMVIFAIEK